MKPCHVYSVCNTGHKLVLRVDTTGTRWHCRKFVRDRARMGRPTHYMHVSSLCFEAAERKFLP